MYGTAQEMNDSLFIPLSLSDFENYEKLIERITTIDCNDSVAQIVIEDENIQRLIFPVVECMPPPEREGFEPNAPIRSISAVYENSFR